MDGLNLFVGVIYNVSEAPNLSSKYEKESLKLDWSTVSSTQMTNEASHPPIPGKAWVWHSNGLIWGLKWKEFTRNHYVTGQALNVLICIQLTAAEISRLDAFQNKSLRRILGKPPTFIDRTETNERMYAEIRDQHGCNFEKFGDTWRKAKLKFFGHILRCSRADPLSQVTFAADGIRPRHVVYRRPGRPKLDWVIESYKDAFSFLNGQGVLFDPANINHLRQVKEHAILRAF